jgi:Flp pilus assembly protein TadG
LAGIANRLTAFARDDDGATAIIFALVLVVLMGATGLAIDAGRAVNTRTNMQDALDAAVLVGARANSDTDAQVAAATKLFNANFSERWGAKNVSVTFAPTSDGELSGTATAQLDATVAGVLGVKQFSIKTASKAAGGAPFCVLVLDPHATQALLVNSGAKVDAPNCEMHVKSTANPAAILNSGSDISTKHLCISGTHIIDNGGTHPNLDTGCSTAADPFAGKLSQPYSSSCTYSNLNFNGGSVTLNPGVYCGWINFNNSPNVRFRPGVYVIKNGGWNVNGGTWSGSGVTFYFADQSKIQFNSGVAANITAPTSGTYQDLVMFEKSGLPHSQMIFDDSRNMSLQGIIYLPSRDVTFNYGSALTSKKMTLVINTLILNQTNWELSPGTATSTTGGIQSVRLIQ